MDFRIGTFVVIAAAIISLNGCGLLYRPDIQQGNQITAQMVSGLQPGMTRREVSRILGTPLINDPFNKDRWDFYYSLKDGETGQVERYLTSVIFTGDRLAQISTTIEQMEQPVE